MDDRLLDVNQHGVLRVPGLMWVSLALLARYWILVMAVTVSVRRSGNAVLLLESGVSWMLLILESPAVALALVAGRRDPQAKALTRLLWKHGRLMMTIAAVSNAAWTGWVLMNSSYWSFWPELFLASCTLLDAAIILAMYTSPYFKQLFQEFPARPPEGATP